jgi:hypothetical protein
MSFYSKVLAGVTIALVAGLAAAQPGVALPPQQPSDLRLSQENRPPEEGVPQLNTTEVRGRITRIDGDEVEMRLTDGELRTYTISEADQERNSLEVGSDVVLSVRGDTVVAIGPSATTSESMRSGSMQTGESSSSSSSTVIRRETTVQQTQQTRPAPAPAPAPAAQPQPVRGLW